MARVRSLDELVELVRGSGDLYVRWSRGPDFDLDDQTSRDELTGAELPGLCANPLAVEEWWGDRSLRTWVARRLHDYSHLRRKRDGVRPWVLEGHELGRGPDNEPLVECRRPVAWLEESVIEEATGAVDAASEEWGPLRRS